MLPASLSLGLALMTLVYGEKFKLLEGVAMTTTSYIITEHTTPTETRCLMMCPEDKCMGVNWNTQVCSRAEEFFLIIDLRVTCCDINSG